MVGRQSAILYHTSVLYTRKKNRKQPTDEKKHMIEMVLFCRENAQKI